MDFLLDTFPSYRDMLIIDSLIFVSFSSFSYLEASFQNILLPFRETKLYRRNIKF